ncbi:MAG TPA: glycosyltransferase family 2 protein, partial [Tepidisphaeraceae bacterium]|nr:glycosyltransferase family 2 protein [Tepidisphaeraceae bacterium]
MPDLSIILPTCNRAEHLLNTIMEIERRTHIDFELIVVDGASTDSTSDVLQLAHSILGNHLRVIREPKREGFVRAVNKGFRAATSPFITWI